MIGNITSNAWIYSYTVHDSYTTDQYNKFSSMEWHLDNGTLDSIKHFTYPGYLGIGKVAVMNTTEVSYTGGVATGTYNYTTTYNYSVDGLSVTENNFDGSNGIYSYNITY